MITTITTTETSEEEVVTVLTEHEQIKLDLKLARETLTDRQNNCTRIKKELSKEEDRLVEANEAVRTAVETLRTFEHTKIANVVDEDLRDIEIARLKKNLPELMKRLENEAPIIMKDLIMKEDDEEMEEENG
jgi:hypothetical protein